MYTSVFVYTTASVTLNSNPARGPTDLPESLLTVRSLVKKGNEMIQRYWRLYEFCRASNGPDSDLLIRHVSSIWYPMVSKGGKRCTRMRPEVAPARSWARFPYQWFHGIVRDLEGCAVLCHSDLFERS